MYDSNNLKHIHHIKKKDYVSTRHMNRILFLNPSCFVMIITDQQQMLMTSQHAKQFGYWDL